MRNCVLLILALTLAACNANSETPGDYTPPKPTDANLQELIERSRKQMVFVEGGSFMMGDVGTYITEDDGNEHFYYLTHDDDNKPAHRVTLDSFSISKYETTYWEYDLFTQATKREFARQHRLNKKWRQGGYPTAADWQGAQTYCQWLAELTSLPFALPTEAQWEYAARSGGREVVFATDNGKMEPGRNYTDAIMELSLAGSFPPNPIGLHDMSGNAYEWVFDWYDADYYGVSPENNPSGPASGTMKILRGGSMRNGARRNDVYGRSEINTDFLMDMPEEHRRVPEDFGFRCVVNTPEPVN